MRLYHTHSCDILFLYFVLHSGSLVEDLFFLVYSACLFVPSLVLSLTYIPQYTMVLYNFYQSKVLLFFPDASNSPPLTSLRVRS
jgi:hypothetical protein